MKVILLEEVKGMGKPDDIVEVSAGYANNYLLKRGIALEATPENLNIVKTRKAAQKKKDQKALAEAQRIKSEIEGKVIQIPIKSGQAGRLYGSLTAMDIAAALQKQGFTIDKRGVTVLDTVKTLGVYDVEIRLHTDVQTKIKIELISDQ